jgi:hypothetical protein
VLELEVESDRPNPPKCWPKEEENGGEGFWWWAGTPIAIPPLGAEAEEIEDEGVDGKDDAGDGVAEGGIEEKCE